MHISRSAQEFLEAKFDYLVVGGGNAGFPLAVRLAENPDVKVGILEAGPIPVEDVRFTQPRYTEGTAKNPAYDWCFASVPQKHAGGRQIPLPRGKGLAGSTMLNFMAWDRASQVEYDSWSLLSNKEGAWNWETLLPYFKEV
ncbi:hypothetical protein D9613_000277 [Agrocybe pediades]|uniref:Glucose-methanol-choline oxidoreductase N-terminal domain-containing protein n=1 Tax=Agrocybe pediades TaxID=84607 RepID=A0A8H4QZM6_9AGAR|nr:hypothetical protein D9613_000277 [Agrocybe pediades]